MKWKVAHACVRGSSHVRSGLPNQDAAQCIVSSSGTGSSIAVAAVSDGHGGARHFRSQIGSSLAVSTAVSLLQDFLPAYAGRDGAAALQPAQVQALQRKLVDSWMVSIASDLENHPLSGEELDNLETIEGPESRAAVGTLPQLAYGATLLIAAATDSLVLYLQLGDGEILSVSANGETVRPLPSDERLIGNQTTSLCQPEAWNDFRAAWVTEPALPAVVLLSTDGYANSFRSDEDFLKIGQDYLSILREQGITLLAEELPEILSEATQQGSGDDITLAILQGELRSGVQETISAPTKPRLTPESRSAIINQLKARHSSQRQRLETLTSRVEEVRKTNRRLQAVLALLLLLAAGVALYFYWDRIFPHHVSARNVQSNPVDKPQNPGTPETPARPLSTAAPASAPDAWQLEISNTNILTLQNGVSITRDQIFPGADSSPYARVAPQGGKFILINESGDKWLVSPGKGGEPDQVPKNKAVVLGNKPFKITFAGKVTGRISAVIENSSPAIGPTAPEPGHATGSDSPRVY